MGQLHDAALKIARRVLSAEVLSLDEAIKQYLGGKG